MGASIGLAYQFYTFQSLQFYALSSKEILSATRSICLSHSINSKAAFIMYLEDKGAAGETNLYSKIDKNANCYFDILESVEATYSY